MGLLALLSGSVGRVGCLPYEGIRGGGSTRDSASGAAAALRIDTFVGPPTAGADVGASVLLGDELRKEGLEAIILSRDASLLLFMDELRIVPLTNFSSESPSSTMGGVETLPSRE